jgi:predicted RNase H-like HicB family nuclease
MDRTLRVFRAKLFTVWDHWVVEVPDASGVHALVMQPGEAEEVARQAIATFLEVDPASFQVIVETA